MPAQLSQAHVDDLRSTDFRMVNLRSSSGAPRVAMVETTNSRKGNDLGFRSRTSFDLSALGRVLTQAQMSSILLVVGDVLA